MDVYTLGSLPDEYAALLTVDDGDLDRLQPFDGSPMADAWSPIRMHWETEGGDPIPDFDITVGGGLAFNARALEALGDLLEGRGELLPVNVEGDGGGPHWVFNLTHLSDALDEERSDVARFKSSGRIMDIDRYEFDPERLSGETIFKLAQRPRSQYYATDEFRVRVEEAGLTGFDFRQRIWSGAPVTG
jgi:hypothetical protein